MKKWGRTLFASLIIFSLALPLSAYAAEPPDYARYKEKQNQSKQAADEEEEENEEYPVPDDLQAFLKDLHKRKAEKKITQEEFMDELLKWLMSHSESPSDRDDRDSDQVIKGAKPILPPTVRKQ